MPVVRLVGVARTYPSSPPVSALLPVTLTVERGEFLAIMGPSGSGKSTLLNILGLLDTPTAGEYFLDGSPTSQLSEGEQCRIRSHKVGFVFQSFQLLPYRSALDNVSLGLLYQRTSRRQRDQDARFALERVGLGHRLWSYPTTLSGGECQRVALARALVKRPSLVLCDEPTGNLDTATSQSVLSMLGELWADGMTVVVITHDPEVAAHAERVLYLRDGRLGEASGVGAGSL